MAKAKSNTDPKGRQFISRMRKLPVSDAPTHKSPNGAKEAFGRTTKMNKQTQFQNQCFAHKTPSAKRLWSFYFRVYKTQQTQSNPNFVTYSNFRKRIAIFKPATTEGAFAAFTPVSMRHQTQFGTSVDNSKPLMYNDPMQNQWNQTDLSDFTQACHKVAEYGLVRCSSGNMSCRIGTNAALLSASGAWLAELTSEQVAVCDIQTGRILNQIKPTCESVFHLKILKNRSDINIVLHFQSPYATAIACGEPENADFNMTIEVPVYIGTPAIVPYLPPGSQELAQATAEAFKNPKTTLAILKNHGLVTIGADLNDAIQKACFFEMTCQILLTNPDTKPLDAAAIQYLNQLSQA